MHHTQGLDVSCARFSKYQDFRHAGLSCRKVTKSTLPDLTHLPSLPDSEASSLLSSNSDKPFNLSQFFYIQKKLFRWCQNRADIHYIVFERYLCTSIASVQSETPMLSIPFGVLPSSDPSQELPGSGLQVRVIKPSFFSQRAGTSSSRQQHTGPTSESLLSHTVAVKLPNTLCQLSYILQVE